MGSLEHNSGACLIWLGSSSQLHWLHWGYCLDRLSCESSMILLFETCLKGGYDRSVPLLCSCKQPVKVRKGHLPHRSRILSWVLWLIWLTVLLT